VFASAFYVCLVGVINDDDDDDDDQVPCIRKMARLFSAKV